MVDTTALTGTWTLDLAHTRIGFSARHAMVTKVRGHFAEFEGTAHIDGENPSASSVNVTIQTASIDTNNKMRDDHLRTCTQCGTLNPRPQRYEMEGTQADIT